MYPISFINIFYVNFCIFKNTEMDLNDIGETMQAYCESIGRKNG